MLWLLLPALAGTPPATDAPGEALPARHWDVVHLDLDVRVDPAGGTVSGIATHTIEPFGLPGDVLRLDQVGLDIATVTVDDAPVTPRIGPSFVEVPVSPGVPHTVAITYSASPQTGVHFRQRTTDVHRALEAWTQGEDEDNRHWFPGWDHPSDRFTLTTTLTVPEGLHAVANGVLETSEPAEDGWWRWRYTLDDTLVTYLVAFAVGEHTVHTLPDGPVPLEIIAPRSIPAEVATRGLDEVAEMMAWMQEVTGQPYPHDIYRQVVVQRFLYGGMENTTTTLLSDRVLAWTPDDPDHRARAVAAHELAHQWFGDLLTCRGWRELWLNEGFAEFYETRWREQVAGREAYAADVLRWAPSARGTTRPMAARGWSKVDDRANTAVYTRGATVLHMLRTWLGDEAFDTAIQDYVAQHAEGLVETDDLRRAFERVSGRHLGWFFDTWVHGFGAPKLATSHRWAADELTITIRQDTAERPAYQGPVSLAWALADGSVHRHTLWLDAGETRLVTPAPGGVSWTMVAPRAGLLAVWDRTQTAAEWAAAATSAPDPATRLVAIAKLGEAKDDEVAVGALAAVLDQATTDAHRPYVLAAMRALAARASEDALPVVLDLGDRWQAAPLARDARASALGAFSLSAGAEDALVRIARTDPTPTVRATALSALAKVRPSRALAEADAAMRRKDPSVRGEVHEAALDVLADLGDVSHLQRWWRLVDDRRVPVQTSAGNTAVEIAKRAEGLSPALERSLVVALAGWLESPDLRLRGWAVYLLGQLGSEAAIGPLKAYRARSLVPGVDDRVRTALTAIRARTGSDDPDALAKALADLEALRDRVEELEDTMRDASTRRP